MGAAFELHDAPGHLHDVADGDEARRAAVAACGVVFVNTNRPSDGWP